MAVHQEKGATSAPKHTAPIFFTNTLSGKKGDLCFAEAGRRFDVLLRADGLQPRAYWKYARVRLDDLISRTLRNAGYHLRQVINITDVGHLVGDLDEGEDKVEVSAKAEGLRAEDICRALHCPFHGGYSAFKY